MDTTTNSEKESGIAYSKLTNTPVPYKGRWENKLYKTEYVRWHRQTVVGLKRRPTKNPDGSLYRDTHPECNLPYSYKRSETWHCDVCNIDMLEGYKRRHLVSKGHLLRETLQTPSPPPTPASTPTPLEAEPEAEPTPTVIPIAVSKFQDRFERRHNNLSMMYRGIIQNATECN